ncbi:cell adhesion molecule Dscam1-like isoform X2 [Ornithodoros turicata]
MHKMYVDSNLNLGDQVDLMCSLRRGSSPVTFSWYHNGKEITAEDKLGSFVEIAGKSILVVDKITREHIGNYTCSVKNPAGTDSYTVKLYVDVKPTWTQEPKDTSASTSSTVVIHCNAFGYPPPRIEWSRQNEEKEFVPLRMGDRYNMAPNGSLQIRSAKADDAGHFRCDVTNGLGNGLSKVVKLSISSPPRILERAEVTTVRRGHSVRLGCEATGDRPLVVHWTKDQRAYEGTVREGFDIIERRLPGGVTSELLIQNSSSSDTGVYTCDVANQFGNATAVFKLFVLEPPSPPVGIKVSEIRSKTVRLTWQAPYSEVNTFHIRFWRESSQSRKLTLITVSGSETSVYLSDLLPGTGYGGYMLSENRVGISVPSTSLHFLTSEEAPTASPLDVRISGLGSTHFKIQWKPPPSDHQNGKIQGYYVGYRPYESSLPYTYQTVTGPDPRQAVVRGLQLNTRYSVVVQAFNTAGTGPSSHQLVLTTLEEDLPDPPPFTISKVTCCSVALTLTDKNRDRKSLTQYVLQYRERDGGLWKSIFFPPHAQNIGLEGLRRQTTYEVALAAYSMYGRGDATEPTPFTTTADDALKTQGATPPLPRLFHCREQGQEGYGGLSDATAVMQARLILPVVASLIIISSSVAVAVICYKRIAVKKDSPILYQATTLRRASWANREYATIARSTMRRMDEAYDVPWDMNEALEADQRAFDEYTLLKNRPLADPRMQPVMCLADEEASVSTEPQPPTCTCKEPPPENQKK